MLYTNEQLDEIVSELNAAGDQWKEKARSLSMVRAYDDARGSARAVIELDAPRELNVRMKCTEPYTILYRSESSWFAVGWSDAGRSRPGRHITPSGIEMFEPVILQATAQETADHGAGSVCHHPGSCHYCGLPTSNGECGECGNSPFC